MGIVIIIIGTIIIIGSITIILIINIIGYSERRKRL